jgi:hypothetical protein
VLERATLGLKIVCAALAALVLFQLAGFATRRNVGAANVSEMASGTGMVAPAVKKETNSTTKVVANKATDISPEVQARIDRITQSEILGQVVRPLPMALLGIAGKDVFFRAPNGQTGLLKEGGELGGIKLLQVGTNRVLIEQDGQKKELLLFSGIGGATLLPKGKEPPIEIPAK